MSKRRIMVIDDEFVIGKMIKLHFEEDGYEVEIFLNAEPALARIKEADFDLVVTDLKMKGIDGMEVLREIKTQFPQIKVIMVTAFASLDSAVEAFRGKVDDFFSKPFKIKDLKASAKRLLSQ